MNRAIIVLTLFLSFILFDQSQRVWAADRYFLNNTTDWNDTANWSATSGGAGGASVPVAADNVYFDANSGDCLLPTISVRIFEIGIDYSGVITQTGQIQASNEFRMYGGTFHGGTHDIYVMRFLQTAGEFTSTSGILQANVSSAGSYIVRITGGKFYHNNGTVKVMSTNHCNVTGLEAYPFYDVVIQICNTCDFNGLIYADNDINAINAGNASLSMYLRGNYYSAVSSCNVYFIGTGNQNIYGSKFKNLIIDKPSGKIYVYTDIVIGDISNNLSGTEIVWNQHKTTISTTQNFKYHNNMSFYDLEVNHRSGVNLGGVDLVVLNDLIWNPQSGPGNPLGFPGLKLYGNLYILTAVGNISGIIEFVGTTDQTIYTTAHQLNTHMIINKPSGSVILDGDLELTKSGSYLTITQGAFDTNNHNFSVNGAITVNDKLITKGNEISYNTT